MPGIDVTGVSTVAQGPDEFFHVYPIHQQGYELGSNQNLGMSCLIE